MSAFDSLAAAPYTSLGTFRKSGAMVATPVWCAPHDGYLYLFSSRTAGKVKRLRNSPQAQLAVCDFNGNVQSAWTDAAAHLVKDPDEIEAALTALRKKYGWQMRIADLGAKLTGRFARRVYVRVNVGRPVA
jgi:PPOX class probable F420-dependent enzyme